MPERKRPSRRPSPPVSGHPAEFKAVRHPLPDGHLHLRDARFDLDGNIYAAGHMTFPADPQGLFSVPQSLQEIRVEFDRGGIRFGPCTTMRDPETGFLHGSPTGSVWALPATVAGMVHRCLKSGAKNPVHASGNEGGVLYAVPLSPVMTAPTPPHQYLSDILAEADEVDGVLRFRLSAALRQIPPTEPVGFVEKDRKDYWPLTGSAQRIEATIMVDPMTQALRFGKLLKLPQPPDDEAEFRAPRTSVSALRLEHALIGWHTVFGVSDTGWLMQFFDGSSGVAISGGRCKHRRIDGLLSDTPPEYMWPRVWLYGFGLDTIGALMSNQTRLELVLRGEHLGVVDYTGGPEAETPPIREADLSFELTVEGLVISYCVVPAGDSALSGRLTLAWEMIILRFPQFLRHRRKIAEAAR